MVIQTYVSYQDWFKVVLNDQSMRSKSYAGKSVIWQATKSGRVVGKWDCSKQKGWMLCSP